jgi:hypothetical protein
VGNPKDEIMGLCRMTEDSMQPGQGVRPENQTSQDFPEPIGRWLRVRHGQRGWKEAEPAAEAASAHGATGLNLSDQTHHVVTGGVSAGQ